MIGLSHLWLYSLIVFVTQEQVATNALLFYIKSHDLIGWPFLLGWTVFTIFDVYVGYVFGQWVRKRFKNNPLNQKLEIHAKRIESSIGVRGEYIILILIGIINFPYINAFFCSWLDIKLSKLILLFTIGNVISYIITWETISWVHDNITNPFDEFVGIILITVALSLLGKLIYAKSTKK